MSTLQTAPAAEAKAEAEAHNRLEHYPITFFATVMGMLGLTLALHAGERALGMDPLASHIALALSVALLVAVAIGYAMKAATHWEAVKWEWHHPVRLSFFPTISISILLLAIATASEWPAIATPLWIVGTVLQGVLMLVVVSSWIGHKPYQHMALNPAWFIPAVGNVVVPVAGAQLGFTEVSWLFFSAGLIFWIVLLTLVINRLTFHDPLPGRLQPTLVILMAPPAVAFIAYVRLTGQLDPFGHILVNLGYVFAAIVATQLTKILRLPFALSFWALSFPLAALTISSFVYAGLAKSVFYKDLGLALLALLLVLIVALIYRTAIAIKRHEICVPE